MLIKSTPGPWYVRKHLHDGATRTLFFVEAGLDATTESDHLPGTIANVGGLQRKSDPKQTQRQHEAMANALLMAAAPELLAACLSAKEALSGAVTQHSTGCGIYQQRACDCWLPMRRSALAEIGAVLEKLSISDLEEEDLVDDDVDPAPAKGPLDDIYAGILRQGEEATS